ncbi:MAG: DUF1428 domain-containing protein [Bacteroidetes bacterium]|nr:DUF1428 domain-containing protein [Bacteroidota bacterium]
MRYVDGFVLAIPKKKFKAYTAMAKLGARLWRKHGAVNYWESVSDDVSAKGSVSFPRSVKLKRGEVVVLSCIEFKSRAHRDQVNKKVMNDPQIKKFMDEKNMPFDMKRMLYGGFKTFVAR